jgi:hypothetical protein
MSRPFQFFPPFFPAFSSCLINKSYVVIAISITASYYGQARQRESFKLSSQKDNTHTDVLSVLLFRRRDLA